MAQYKLSRLEELKRLKLRHEQIQREKLKRVDVFAALGYTPTPRQQAFHDATEFDVLYGGAMGGGKTVALLMEGIRACVKYPGIRVGAFRRTYPELKESLLRELGNFGYANVLGAKWAGGDYELRFPNGSVLTFKYAENMVDASRRQGGEFQMLLFDERTLTSADVLTFLESRLRTGKSNVPVLGIRSASNPGGPSHTAAKDRYIKPTKYGEEVVRDVRGRTVRFIPSRLSDNPHLNEEYRQDLLAFPEQLRKAYLDGNWDVFEGQVFGEIDYDRHVMDPVSLPETWRRYAGVDWGFAAPWAVVWAALDPDGRLWVYREMYQAGVLESDQAQRIKDAEREEHVNAHFADDAMWNVQGEAKPIATKYAEMGVHLEKAGKGPGSRVQGWQRIHTFLAEAPACPYHRELGWETCPRMHIFKNCMKLFDELANLPYAKSGNIEDADTKAPDHAADALRYLVMNVGTEARFHWPVAQSEVVELDPKARDRSRPPEYGYNTIGGFPILGSSGSPWGV